MSEGGNSMNGLFGVNIWWTVPTMVVDGKNAQEALELCGFDKDMMKLPSRRTEVSRAVYSFQNRHGKSNRRVAEKADDNGKNVVYGILDRRKVASDKVKFSQTTTVYLDKDNGSVRCEGRLASEVLESIHEYTGKITDDDVRGYLRSIIRMCYGIAKRPSGGIYFVPAQYVQFVEDAQKVLDEIGGGAKLYVERVMDGVQERANVWGSVEEEMERQLNEALLSVDRIERSANAVKNHQMKLEGLDELMDVYKNLLGEEAKYEAITERIEEAVSVVQDKMVKLQQGTASSVKKAAKSKLMEAAVKVLKAKGSPMEFTEIAKEAIASGLYKGNCENPASSISTAISKAINRGDKRVVRIRRGVYTMAK